MNMQKTLHVRAEHKAPPNVPRQSHPWYSLHPFYCISDNKFSDVEFWGTIFFQKKCESFENFSEVFLAIQC